VIGARRVVLTREDLPPANEKRWVPRRKAIVVAAVRGEIITLEEACQRYNLTMEEFTTWERAMDSGGLKALRVTGMKARRKRLKRN
jgi:hypothetical protein